MRYTNWPKPIGPTLLYFAIETINFNYRTTAGGDGKLTLNVTESGAEDSGYYEVRVISDCGKVVSGSQVLVHFEEPRFSLPLTDSVVSLGENIQLTCTATGIPGHRSRGSWRETPRWRRCSHVAGWWRHDDDVTDGEGDRPVGSETELQLSS